MIGLNENALRTNQDGLENKVSIHRAALSPTSGPHCKDNRTTKAECWEQQELHSKSVSNEGRSGTEDSYVLDKIIRHIGFGPCSRYVVSQYWYGKTNDTAKPPTTYRSTLATSTGGD